MVEFFCMKIPFYKPSITWREKLAIFKQMGTGDLTSGSKVEEFEEAFADYVGSRFAVAVSSCSDALFLSLQCLGVEKGDRGLVPSFTFSSSASSIIHAGAEPVFCDIETETFCLHEEDMKKEKPKTTIFVLYAGNVPNWIHKYDKIGRMIFDSAHLLERNCYLGGLQCFSFHGTKNITTGFGGMIATNNEEWADWLRIARMHGCYKKDWTHRYGYEVQFCGWKKNMNNLQAVMGIEQLKRLDSMNR